MTEQSLTSAEHFPVEGVAEGYQERRKAGFIPGFRQHCWGFSPRGMTARDAHNCSESSEPNRNSPAFLGLHLGTVRDVSPRHCSPGSAIP